MALKTVNGRSKPKNPQSIDLYETTERREKRLLAAEDNRRKTNENRSPERDQKQKQAHQRKQEAESRLAEIEKILTDEIASGLVDRIVASFKEIGIDETLKRFKNDLKTFNVYSEEYSNLQAELGLTKTIPFYVMVLYNLAKQYPKFIAYLPTNCFTYGFPKPLPFGELDADDLHELESRFGSEGLFKNPIFKTRYTKYFPNHIAEITDVSDMAFALSLNPACYNRLSVTGQFRSSLFQNPHPLNTIIKKSPLVLKYLTKEELYIFTDNFTSSVGKSIEKYPEILSSPIFTNEYFERFGPKYIFGSINKAKLRPRIAQYFGKLPILENYFNVQIFNNKSKKSLPDESVEETSTNLF